MLSISFVYSQSNNAIKVGHQDFGSAEKYSHGMYAKCTSQVQITIIYLIIKTFSIKTCPYLSVDLTLKNT